jgi:hypothetical protein
MSNEARRAPESAINELDTVTLTHPLPAHGLEVGAIGTVVAVHDAGAAFHVEFAGTATGAGAARSVRVRVPREQVRRAEHGDA